MSDATRCASCGAVAALLWPTEHDPPRWVCTACHDAPRAFLRHVGAGTGVWSIDRLDDGRLRIRYAGSGEGSVAWGDE